MQCNLDALGGATAVVGADRFSDACHPNLPWPHTSSVLHRLKLVDQLVDYAIAKLIAHCDHQTNCQPLDDRGANVVFDPLQIADHVCNQIGLV